MSVKHLTRRLLHTLLGMSGFVRGHMTPGRTVIMAVSLIFSMFTWPQICSPVNAMYYFGWSTCFYASLIFLVLSKNGVRHVWIKAYGEEKAFRLFESLLAFAFFHNALGLTSVSQATATIHLWGNIPGVIIYTVAGILFISGMLIKIWAAWILGIPLYYWKDMFLNRKVKDFVIKGPYKHLSNPMYGAGQLQVYAIAIYYGSLYGLLCALINQLMLFTFYYSVEYPFIKKVYTHEPLAIESNSL